MIDEESFEYKASNDFNMGLIKCRLIMKIRSYIKTDMSLKNFRYSIYFIYSIY
jgi:hypothetical protein